VGGRRKLDALGSFADKYNQPLSNWVVVGESITDFGMLEAVDEAGGLAIAFNANQYALPYATMGLASTNISDLDEVLKVWQKGQRKGVEKLVRGKEKAGSAGDRGHLNWLSGRKDLADIIELHQKLRRLVREETGKLG
jgi:energy-converting hydrogenase A subunit R